MNKKLFAELKKSIQQIKDIQSGKLRSRRTWLINPKTRVKASGKIYKRSLSKKEVSDLRKQEDF